MKETRNISEIMNEMKMEYSMDFLNLLNENERQHCFFKLLGKDSPTSKVEGGIAVFLFVFSL